MTSPSAVADTTPAASGSAIDDRAVMRVVLFAVLGVAIPWVIAAEADQGDRGAIWIAFLLVAVWSGGHLAVAIADGVPRLYTFVFWLFCYLFMGIAAMVQFRTGDMAGTTPRLVTEYDVAAAVTVIAGIAAFEVGSILARFGTPGHAHRSAAPTAGRPDHRYSLLLLVAATPVFVYYVNQLGLGTFFTSRDRIADVRSGAFPDPTTASVVAGVSWVPALVVLHRIVGRRFRTRLVVYPLRPSEIVAVVVGIAMIVVANNPLTSSRYAFGSMALSFVVLFGGFDTLARSRRSMAAVVVAFVVLFPIADAFRQEQRTAFTISLFDEYAGNSDYDAIGQIHNAIRVVDGEGYTWLQQPSGAALFWVPRSIWDGKPTDTGAFLAEQRGYRYVNLSSPIWAELYLAAGTVAVVLGFGALGRGLSRLDDRLASALLSGHDYPVIGSFMPFYLIIVLRGSLLQAMALATTFVIATLITKPRVVPEPLGAPVPVHPGDDSAALDRLALFDRWERIGGVDLDGDDMTHPHDDGPAMDRLALLERRSLLNGHDPGADDPRASSADGR